MDEELRQPPNFSHASEQVSLITDIDSEALFCYFVGKMGSFKLILADPHARALKLPTSAGDFR